MQFTDSRSHDVISYLQRPQVVNTFMFDTGAKRGDLLTGKVIKRIPDILLTDMYRAKLDGFTSFRATAVIRLQINAQKFQAGRLIMYSVPMPDLTSPRADWIAKHVTMAQALHNVQMDIATQSEVELRIPFISPFNSYDLINGQFAWAAIYVMVYSPLNEVEHYPLQCLLWAHFEDIELGAPTSGVIAKQQSGNVSRMGNSKKGAPKQIGAEQAKEARRQESGGLLTEVSAGATKGWSKVGETIPFLSPVTDILGGLSSAAGSFLKPLGGLLPSLGGLFGLSKPILSHSGNTVIVRPLQYFGNVDGIDHSHVLSLSALNAIDEFPNIAGTDLEETSLDFLKSIPQYVGNFCFGEGNKYNDKLFEILVTPTTRVPASVKFQPGDRFDNLKEFDSFQPTVLNYISAPFVYWTGSLVYTFRFIKTQFHSGRVEISFHPYVTKVDVNRMNYVYRLVVDLRENSEISVSVPYISPTPWKVVDTTIDPLVLQPWETIGRSCVGVLYVRALTPLVCANKIISNNVDCVVEVRAGSNYALQCPTKSPFMPLRIPSTIPTEKIAKQQSGTVYALPGTFETRTSAIEGKMPHSITGNASDVEYQSVEQFTAGEKFVDYRAFSRRFGFCKNVEKDKVSSLNFSPIFLIRTPDITGTSGVIHVGEETIQTVGKYNYEFFPTPLTYVSSLYTFYRGSLRLKIYSSTPNLLQGKLLFRDEVTSGLPSLTFLSPIQFEQSKDKVISEFQIPYYSPTMITVPYADETPKLLASQPQVIVHLSSTLKEVEDDAQVAIAAGDDMSFHMFLGVPIVVLFDRLGLSQEVKTPKGEKIQVASFDLPAFYPSPVERYVDGSGQEFVRQDKMLPILSIDRISVSDTTEECKNIPDVLISY